MRALQFTDFGPVSNLRVVELPDPLADQTTARRQGGRRRDQSSDVKNVEGKMEHVTPPPRARPRLCRHRGQRPGRVGRRGGLGGNGGEIGYTVDGSHAELIAVPIASLRRKAQYAVPRAGRGDWRHLSRRLARRHGVRPVGCWRDVAGDRRGRRGRNAAAQIGKWRRARVIESIAHETTVRISGRRGSRRLLCAWATSLSVPSCAVSRRPRRGCRVRRRGRSHVRAFAEVPLARRGSRPRSHRLAIAGSASTFSLSITTRAGCLGVDTRHRDAVASAERCSRRSLPFRARRVQPPPPPPDDRSRHPPLGGARRLRTRSPEAKPGDGSSWRREPHVAVPQPYSGPSA